MTFKRFPRRNSNGGETRSIDISVVRIFDSIDFGFKRFAFRSSSDFAQSANNASDFCRSEMDTSFMSNSAVEDPVILVLSNFRFDIAA